MIRMFLMMAFALAICACSSRPETVTAPAGDLLAKIKASGHLRVGVKADTPPFGVKNGDRYAGFDIDLAEALASQLGVEHVDYVAVNSADREAKLLSGEVDCLIASMTITRARETRVDFTLPYFQDGLALLVKVDAPIQSYLDLKGKKIGVVSGSTAETYLPQVAPNGIIISVQDYAALLAALRAGSVDAISTDLLILAGLRKSAPDAAQLRIAGERFSAAPYGIAVPENQSKLRDALNNALFTLWETGRWRLIAESWFGPGAPYESPIDFAIAPYPK